MRKLVLIISVSFKKPNIIVVLLDDMGFSDLGFMGSGIETSNLCILANKGLVFNPLYNTECCYQTRASFLTGLYAHKTQSKISEITKELNSRRTYQPI